MITHDERWMRRALALAARGFTPPNPMVGCVLVKDGAVVGEGFHPKAGEPHAEVFALRDAGENARGATAYVTLEPCSHHGRTPPCADALISAGVRRVVVAVQDPNPRVTGDGVGRLRNARVEVEVGLLGDRATTLNAAFFHFHRTGLPLVTIKAAMTLDGKIASRTGDSRWVTGESARRYVHRLRARSGAVMVGVGTLLADDPRLTARFGDRDAQRQPLRVVVDSRLRTPPGSLAVSVSNDAAPLLIVGVESAATAVESRAKALRRGGAEVITLPGDSDGHVDLYALVRTLGEREVVSVLVEGGGTLNGSLLYKGLADRALFFVAPKLIGGAEAPTPVEGIGLERMEQAYRVTGTKVRRFGPDFAIEGSIDYSAPPSEAIGQS